MANQVKYLQRNCGGKADRLAVNPYHPLARGLAIVGIIDERGECVNLRGSELRARGHAILAERN